MKKAGSLINKGSKINIMEILKEANNNIKLHVEFYPYERYGGGGGKRKANISAPDMLTALKKLVDKMRLYIDSEQIEDEGYTPEEVIEQIQMSNGDGCDYITLLQEMNSGDILIQEDYDEEEDWDDMDESLNKEPLKEDLENLEKVDATTTMNITMGTAKEESKTLWQRLEDAEKVPEDAPLFGAKDQPVPEEVKEPKVTLDESLFNEGISGFYFAKLAAKAAKAIEDFQDAFTGLPYDFDVLIEENEIMDLDQAVKVLHQLENRARDLAENVPNKEQDESLVESDNDDVEITQEMIDDILDEVKGVFTEAQFTTDQVVDEIFDCIEDDSKYEFAKGVLEAAEEDIEDGLAEGLVWGESTLDDYLDVIKKYYKGRKVEDVIDSIFKMFPDSETAYNLASSLGEVVEDYLDECKLAENFI